MSITKGRTDMVVNCGYFLAINGGALMLKDGLKFEIPKQETQMEVIADTEVK